MSDWLWTIAVVAVVFALPFVAGWIVRGPWERRRIERALAAEAEAWLEDHVSGR